MKKLVLKNSLVVAFFALIMLFLFMPNKVNAADCPYEASSLNGYVLTVTLPEDVVIDYDTLTVYGYYGATIELGSFEMENPFNAEGSFVVDEANRTVTLDVSEYCKEVFETSPTVGVQVNFRDKDNWYGTERLFFDKAIVEKTVNSEATEDTTFEYDVDSVYTLNGDAIEEALEIIDDHYKGADEFLLNAEYFVKNDEAKKAVAIAENSVVVPKGKKAATGYVVISVLGSKLIDLDDDNLLGYKTSLWSYISFVGNIPLFVNVKEVKAGKFTVSNDVCGLTLRPITDYLQSEKGIEKFVAAFTDEKNTAEGLIKYFDDGVITFNEVFSTVGYKNYANNPQNFFDELNGCVRGFVASFQAGLLNSKIMKSFNITSIEKLGQFLDQKNIGPRDIVRLEAEEILKATGYAAVDNFKASCKLTYGDKTFYFAEGVNTGDSNNMVLFVVMFVMAVVAAGAVALKRN